MFPLAVTFFELSLFVHITAVVIGFGATFAEALMFPVAMSLDKRHLPYVHKLQLAINQRLAGPALGIVLLTGLYQVHHLGYELGKLWLSASMAIIVALGALSGAYFIPTDRKLGAMVERELAAGGELSEDYLSQARREGIVGAIAGLLVLVAIYLMVTKPGL